MAEKDLASTIANLDLNVIKKIAWDGLSTGADYVKILLGTENTCSDDKLKEIKEMFIKEEYKAEVLVEPVECGESLIFKRYIVVRGS